MKAKVKVTGEIVDVSKTWNGWIVDSPTEARVFNETDLDFEYERWEQFRANAAKDILCALIAQGKPIMVTEDGGSYPSWNQRHFAKTAIEYADLLIKQLREGK